MKLKKWLALTHIDADDDIFENNLSLGPFGIEEAATTSIYNDEDAQIEIPFAQSVINSILEDLKTDRTIFNGTGVENDFSHIEEQIETSKASSDPAIININTIKGESPSILFNKNNMEQTENHGKPLECVKKFLGHELNNSDAQTSSQVSTDEKCDKHFLEDTKDHASPQNPNLVQTMNVVLNNHERPVKSKAYQENNSMLKKPAAKINEKCTLKVVIKKLSDKWVSSFLSAAASKKNEEKINTPPCNPIKSKYKKRNFGGIFRTKHAREMHSQMRGSELCPSMSLPVPVNKKSLSQRNEGLYMTDQPYECTICQKSFKTRCGLRRHGRHHKEAGERRPYECSICEKSFRMKSDLWRHELKHTANRPYECKLCKKSFASKRNLEKHQESHEAKKVPR